MQALKFKAVIDEKRLLSVTLPPDIRAGVVEVVVLQESASAGTKGPSDEAFAELMAFHKGRRLDGITLRELKDEGRR